MLFQQNFFIDDSGKLNVICKISHNAGKRLNGVYIACINEKKLKYRRRKILEMNEKKISLTTAILFVYNIYFDNGNCWRNCLFCKTIKRRMIKR